MKLKKGDKVYSAKLDRVFTIQGKVTEFDFDQIWGKIYRRGQLSYSYIDENGEFSSGEETVQYIPKVGDVLVRGKDLFVTKSVDDEGVNTESIAGDSFYWKEFKFQELSSISILRNFKLG